MIQLNQAKLLLAQDPHYKRGFKFDHVWPILKDIEKFASTTADNVAYRVEGQRGNLFSSQSDGPSVKSPGSASPNLSSFDLNINEDGIGGSSSERPIGVKKAKGKRKKDEQLSRIIQQNEQLVEIFTKGNSDLQRCQATQI